MTSIDTPYLENNDPDGAGRLTSATATLVLFALTLFTSALLLFSVQPLFTKMVLPKLGGSPSVWSVAMVFFQGTLLAGYGYAHALTRFTRPKIALIVHILVLLIAFLVLPIAVAHGWGRPPATGQAFWLVGLFAVSVGLPFFAVAANGPLLQAWFARTGHPHAADPYFLYGASNIGSFAALISYPILFEPVFSLGMQAWMWSVGFVFLALLIAASGMLAVRSGIVTAAESEISGLSATKPTVKRRLTWVGLAFVPSALLVAVTQHVSTDIGAAPFLWVVPLALFLLTFVITFQRKPVLRHAWMTFLLPILAGPLVVYLFYAGVELTDIITAAIVHFITFFVAAMVCHGELVRRRPAAAYLTEFYLWMSFGGVLGGIFTGLVAPYVFSTVVEYPLLIGLVFLCRSELYASIEPAWRRDGVLIAAATAILLIPGFMGYSIAGDAQKAYFFLLVACAALIMLSRETPRRHLALLAATLMLGGFYNSTTGVAEYHRSFFGVHKIAESRNGQFRLLFHGTTLHGAERIRNADGTPYTGEPVPTTYYYPEGPLVQTVTALRERHKDELKVAAIGLGSGSLACASKPGDRWKFFEIDSDVVKIARDPRKFRFLEACGRDIPITIGDARITMEDEKTAAFDLIIVDAFSSDAIPVHLLTREALALYLDKLSENGAIAFHISNRYMRLAPIVASIAETHGLVTYSVTSVLKKRKDSLDSSSIVAIVARDRADLGTIATNGIWREVPVNTEIKPWSDDYSNVPGAIFRNFVSSGSADKE